MALNLVGRMRRAIGSRYFLTRQGTVSLVDTVSDIDEFRSLCADADRCARENDTSGERACLTAALGLVHGVPFADWVEDPIFGSESIRLQHTVNRARLRASQLALSEGDHQVARVGAEEVLAEDSLSQEALGILMSALAAEGRVREALTAYQDAKGRLAEESGLDPDPDLAALYSQILRSGAELSPGSEPVPRQLPALTDYVPVHPSEHAAAGRLLDAPSRSSPALLAVNGCGGIGKTAFALELAHAFKDRFPDGQLFADLHGNAPGQEPIDARRVLRHFLRSMGYGADRWTETEEAAAHFRSVTADLRVLIVLDDAREAAQIRPLLPNGPGCAVIATSRHAMSSLRGAEHLELTFLDTENARALFRSGVDHAFAPEDEQAIDGVLDRCAGLPLAVCITSARFNAAEPGSLPGILASLTDRTRALSRFEDGEHSLAASLAGSLDALASVPNGPEAVELFTMMALHPGPALPVEIAAALVDEPVATVRHLGEMLHRYRLAHLQPSGHFSMHDLVRLFATSEAAKLDREATVAAARRMRSAYLAAGVRRTDSSATTTINRWAATDWTSRPIFRAHWSTSHRSRTPWTGSSNNFPRSSTWRTTRAKPTGVSQGCCSCSSVRR